MRTGDFTLTFDGRKDSSIRVQGWPLSSPPYFEITAAPGAGLYPLERDTFRRIDYREDLDSVYADISSVRPWGRIQTTLELPKALPGLIHWKVDIETNSKIAFPESEYDALFKGNQIRFVDLGKDNPAQVPLLYFYEEEMNATCLFYADYTTLNDYYIGTGTRPAFSVGTNMPTATYLSYPCLSRERKGFGYYRPPSLQPIPPQTRMRVTDSYCFLVKDRPASEIESAQRFIHCLGQIYPRMTKPQTVYTNWPQIANYEIRDIQRPDCWTRPFDGRKHLLPYVNHKDLNANDLRTELQILAPLVSYNRIFPSLGSSQLEQQLAENVKAFYAPSTRMLTNMITPPGPSSVRDSFYPAINSIMLGKVILRGVNAPQLKDIFLNFSDASMEVGRKIDYTFPWQVDWMTGKIVNDSFWEYDVGGAFAYVFLQCYEISQNPKYLEEAKRAIESIRGHGFSLPHELDTTAAAGAACARLYELTGNEYYLDLSLIPLANILRRCWFWESEYDYGKYVKMFFSPSFARNGPQIAPLETMGVWDMLDEYYRRTYPVLTPELSLLLPEFHKWMNTVMRYFYPPLLPPEAIAPGPAGWPVSPDLYIMLEDMNDGHTRLGTVGQGIYMSRAGIELAASVYRILDNGVRLFSEYPILASSSDVQAATLAFSVGGRNDFSGKVKIWFPEGVKPASQIPFLSENGCPVDVLETCSVSGNELEIDIPGGSEVLIATGLPCYFLAMKHHLAILTQGCRGDRQIADSLENLREELVQIPANQKEGRCGFHRWFQKYSELRRKSEHPKALASESAAWTAIDRIAAKVSEFLLGIRFHLDVPRLRLAQGDGMILSASLDCERGVNLQDLQFDLSVPFGWDVEKIKPSTFRVRSPRETDSGESAQLVCAATYRYQDACVVQRLSQAIESVPALSLEILSTSGEFAAPGKPYSVKALLRNDSSDFRDADLRIGAPSDWTISGVVSGKLNLAPLENREVMTMFLPTREARRGACEVSLALASGKEESSRFLIVDLVDIENGLIDLGDDPSEWESASDRPKMPVKSENGKLIFGPRDTGFAVRQRQVCIDLDENPILSLKVDQASALWALFADDGKHVPELGIRLQQETWQTGVFHYDLKRATGWNGIKKFDLRYVISICAPDRVSVMDWLTIGEGEVNQEPSRGDRD